MTEEEKRKHRCCFTGHRPEKLYGNEEAVRIALKKEIWHAIADGMCTFITGMCWGTDIIAGELVLECREVDPNIHLICALPHPNFEQRMNEHWKKRFNEVLQRADLSRTISSVKSGECYQTRNVWMVDRAARLISVYNGKSGGTRNTIEYAKHAGIEIVVIDPRSVGCVQNNI